MYNISNEGDSFIVYHDAKFAGTSDDSMWHNARCVNHPCTNCKKRGNTCLHRVIDLYGDVDLRACMWCSVLGVGCSIKQRVRGVRGPRSPKKSLDKGKRKVSELSEDEDMDEVMVKEFLEALPVKTPKARSLPPMFTPLAPLPPSPSPAIPLFLYSPPTLPAPAPTIP